MIVKSGPLDTLLPSSKQYHYHYVLSRSSFYTGIIPNDPFLKTIRFKIYKWFVIVFMFTLCTRTIVECFLDQTKDLYLFLYLGDFKIWWGKPYIANQVVFLAAVFIVPFYQFINLNTICPKDFHWSLPFQFIEGLKTARQIKLEDEAQMNSLHFKMKVNFYRAFILMYSVIISYSICVFASYYIFYETNFEVFTLGIFWTLYECLWTRFITQNMGIYPACLEVITFYLNMRYCKISKKIGKIYDNLSSNKAITDLYRIKTTLDQLNDVNVNLCSYNHYWRKYIMAVFLSYLPQILFEVYICLFFQIETSVMIFAVVLVINMVALISQVCIFSATVCSKAYSMRKILNQVYTQLYCNLRYSANYDTNRFAKRQLLRLSYFMEQYSDKQTGIYLLDFYLIDWAFYFNVVVNCFLYFLLIADILH